MFANIIMDPTQASEISATLRAVGTYVQRSGPPTVRSNALKLQAAVRAHAEGRPGPQKITGAYWDSIQVSASGVRGSSYSSQAGRISMGFESEVYTDAPFARRLELGFVQADSAGRHYNQPPYPHWGPAVAEVEGDFFNDMLHTIDLAVAFKAFR